MALFTEEEQHRIRIAIEDAEKHTSGQIRVCIEKTCSDNVLDRAAKYFHKLEMHKTKHRNGVLVYVATVDRKFAIIGDAGINKVVPADFWDSTKEAMRDHFKRGEFFTGTVFAIRETGMHLKQYFPHHGDQKNELPNEISEG